MNVNVTMSVSHASAPGTKAPALVTLAESATPATGAAPVADTRAAEIAALANLDLYGLRVRWRKLMRKAAPEHLTRSILIRVIAYRMQARVYGDLDAASIRVVEQIAREHERQRKAGLLKPKAVPEVAPAPRHRSHRPGTMFIREHAGEMHRVTVVRDGFEWKGETYRSLSDIAKRITGTTWSGPRFFGLREPPTQTLEGKGAGKASGKPSARGALPDRDAALRSRLSVPSSTVASPRIQRDTP